MMCSCLLMHSALALPEDLRIPAPPRRSRAWALGALIREASLVASAGAMLSWGVAEVAGLLLGY
jgi:hypothetical protein